MANDKNKVSISSASATPPSYRDAVQMAVDYLKGHQHIAVSMGASNTEEEIAHANECGHCFDHLKWEIGRKIQRGWKVEPEYMSWLGDVLTETIEQPKKKRGVRSNSSTALDVFHAVTCLVDAGVTATRNDASEPTSACDAVADAMEKLGRKPASPERVKKIWLNKKPRN